MPSRGEAFRDGVHIHPLRVYYGDTDAGRPVRLPESVLGAYRSLSGAAQSDQTQPDRLQPQVKKRA